MSVIDKLLAKKCKQTAVYWGNPVEDGFGGKTFDDPIELSPDDDNGVRWEEKVQVIIDENGVSHISRAVVFLQQDVDVEGCLYLGTLDDLVDYLDSSAGSYIDPMDVEEGICIIKRFEKTPSLNSSDVFLRKAFLTPWLT